MSPTRSRILLATLGVATGACSLEAGPGGLATRLGARAPEVNEAPGDAGPVPDAASADASDALVTPPAGALPAFPGAEGFGAYATGGRGGRVIYVTNRNTSGPGSLQAALDATGPRYVLFRVSGLIDGDAHLTHGEVTIAGQTSPGGIIVRQFHTTEDPYCDGRVGCAGQMADNWILRHMRMRPAGPEWDDGLRLRYTRNAIIDHVSVANANDEAVELSLSRDITIQNSMLSETLGGHAVYGGMLVNYSDPASDHALDRLSIHHNTWNRIVGRLPELSCESDTAAGRTIHLELSNNLLWDPGAAIEVGRTTASESSGQPYYWAINWVGNYAFARRDFPCGVMSLVTLPDTRDSTWFADNHINLYSDRTDYDLTYCCNDFATYTPTGELPRFARAERHPYPPVTYVPAATLRDHMLAHVGAFPRDPMDRRLLAPVRTGVLDPAPRDTNPYNDAHATDYPADAPPAAPLDSDDDGMPDAWERAHGLDPAAQDHNGTALSRALTGRDGYTNLECYLNELADRLEAAP